MENQNSPNKASDFIRNSPTVKMLSVGLLILLLLIPISMVSSLIRERQIRHSNVIKEINSKWGTKQTITGPFLTIPYETFYYDDNNNQKVYIKYLHVLTKNLNVSGNIDTKLRYRGIYEAVVYNSRLDIKGNFVFSNLNELNISSSNIIWEKAIFSVGITNMQGLRENIEVTYNGKSYGVNPGLKTQNLAKSGVSAIVPLFPHESENTFSFSLNFNGSEQLHVMPLGEETTVDFKSAWQTPSFNGAFLPVERQVGDNGFSAKWKVLHLNRNFPQFWEGNKYKLENSSFGLKLLIPANIYQKSTRIAKYAIMFVVFTFAAFFLTEILSKKRIHPIQYMLIGLSIVLFYVLLISISEHLNFDYAYLISATVITVLITLYSNAVVKSGHFTIILCGILIILYSYFYIVLQLEDYALLMGSIGLLIVLSAVMYITRKVDWYQLGK